LARGLAKVSEQGQVAIAVAGPDRHVDVTHRSGGPSCPGADEIGRDDWLTVEGGAESTTRLVVDSGDDGSLVELGHRSDDDAVRGRRTPAQDRHACGLVELLI